MISNSCWITKINYFIAWKCQAQWGKLICVRADTLFWVPSWNNKGSEKFATSLCVWSFRHQQICLHKLLHFTHCRYNCVSWPNFIQHTLYPALVLTQQLEILRAIPSISLCPHYRTQSYFTLLFIQGPLKHSHQDVLERFAVCSSFNKIILSSQKSSSGLWILIKTHVDIPEKLLKILQ